MNKLSTGFMKLIDKLLQITGPIFVFLLVSSITVAMIKYPIIKELIKTRQYLFTDINNPVLLGNPLFVSFLSTSIYLGIIFIIGYVFGRKAEKSGINELIIFKGRYGSGEPNIIPLSFIENNIDGSKIKHKSDWFVMIHGDLHKRIKFRNILILLLIIPFIAMLAMDYYFVINEMYPRLSFLHILIYACISIVTVILALFIGLEVIKNKICNCEYERPKIIDNHIIAIRLSSNRILFCPTFVLHESFIKKIEEYHDQIEQQSN